VQVKLLQIIQDKRYHRVGGQEPLEADVRIISATNEDLPSLCDAGRFRRDLYYRLNVFPIELPPLRRRTGDIPVLARVFLKRLNQTYPKRIEEIEPRVLAAFQRYGWPGNIRELENLMERAYILEPSRVLTAESFPAQLFRAGESVGVPVDTSVSLAECRDQASAAAEREYLKRVLREHGGRIARTAEAAGIGARQLHKLMKRHGLRKEDFRG
jgi:DNA-binding NtrC family response regulator